MSFRPNERRWLWLTITAWLLSLRGPAFVENLYARPPQELIPDFLQEYASVRGWHDGRPVYADHHESVSLYLGGHLNDRRYHAIVNPHPPTSILLALPLARFDFSPAFLTWNLASLAALAASLVIVQRSLRVAVSSWSLAPLVALLLVCFPVLEQCRLGQLALRMARADPLRSATRDGVHLGPAVTDGADHPVRAGRLSSHRPRPGRRTSSHPAGRRRGIAGRVEWGLISTPPGDPPYGSGA